MTAVIWPRDLLTLDDWEGLDGDTFRRAELVEGVIQMSPAPPVRHQVLLHELVSVLDQAGRAHGLAAVGDVDVILVPGFPPTVRQPDVVVTTGAVVRAGPEYLIAAEVLLAVEIVSPGSARTDRIAKPADYADAGIPCYWIFDLGKQTDCPLSLDVHRLDGASYRHITHAEGGTVDLTEPFGISLALDVLLVS